MKFKKTYKFAFKTAGILFASTLAISVVINLIFYPIFTIWVILLINFIFFCISFIIIQYRVEQFIYKRVKKIVDNVSLLDTTTLKKDKITTDMDTLSKEVQKFAQDKSLEIELLKNREAYRREFLGNVSHELKTPLFTVQGYILTLLEGAANHKKIRNNYLNRANKSVERLINIVQDLDMISKLESDILTPKIKPFNIINLIKNIFEMLEIKAEKRNIILKLDKTYSAPILVKGDAKRIEQVLINLLVNSIKYGNKNGTTIVSINNYNENKFIIHVKDDGEGIKAEHQQRLFERFYRVDKSRSREQGGSGLGLAIVKHIIEAHNEKVFVKSELGVGTTFSFTLEKVV